MGSLTHVCYSRQHDPCPVDGTDGRSPSARKDSQSDSFNRRSAPMAVSRSLVVHIGGIEERRYDP